MGLLTSLDECLLSGQIINMHSVRYEYNLKAHHYLQCHVYTMQHTRTRICMHIRAYEDHHTCHGMLHTIFDTGSPLGQSGPCITQVHYFYKTRHDRYTHRRKRIVILLLFVFFPESGNPESEDD